MNASEIEDLDQLLRERGVTKPEGKGEKKSEPSEVQRLDGRALDVQHIEFFLRRGFVHEWFENIAVKSISKIHTKRYSCVFCYE